MKEIILSKEEKQAVIENIKSYYLTEKDEEITDLSATLLLDFILRDIGPLIYNHAIKDAHHFMNEKLDDIFALEKPMQRSASRVEKR